MTINVSASMIEGLRKSTKALIATSGTPIALNRRGAAVRTPEGGISRSGALVTQPAVNRYFGRISLDTRIDVRSQGQQVIGDYVLIGLHTDDIRIDDFFIVGGRDFHVVWLDPDRSYQFKALVSEDR